MKITPPTAQELAKKLAGLLNGQYAASAKDKPCHLLIVEPAVHHNYSSFDILSTAEALTNALIKENLAPQAEVDAYKSHHSYARIYPIAYSAYEDAGRIEGLCLKYPEFKPYAVLNKVVQLVAPPYLMRALQPHMSMAPLAPKPEPLKVQPITGTLRTRPMTDAEKKKSADEAKIERWQRIEKNFRNGHSIGADKLKDYLTAQKEPVILLAKRDNQLLTGVWAPDHANTVYFSKGNDAVSLSEWTKLHPVQIGIPVAQGKQRLLANYQWIDNAMMNQHSKALGAEIEEQVNNVTPAPLPAGCSTAVALVTKNIRETLQLEAPKVIPSIT